MNFRTIAAFCVAIVSVMVGAPARAGIIVNSGFEATQYGTGYFAYPNATVDNWTYSGQSGLLNALGGNAWYAGSGPTGFGGDQYAFIQTTGSISQTFTSGAGVFSLSFLDTGRTSSCCNGNQTFQVLIDSTVIGTFSTTANGLFALQNIPLISLTAGQHTLAFDGTDPGGGDVTSFIDNVNLTSAVAEPSSAVLFGFALCGVAVLYRRRFNA
jgi:hypothetical protein